MDNGNANMGKIEVDFTCECPLYANEERRLYRVTGTEGDVVTCAYCTDCATFAMVNGTGETAACVPL